MSVTVQDAAARLIADLMPIAITVADAGGSSAAAEFVQALDAAGAGAEVFAPGITAGSDLAVLLADPNPSRHDGLPALIESLAAVSDRLLFVPRATGDEPADLDAWFELLADQGYQPVVDYDAGFLGRGAFLVDRNATAAENDLSAFADRLSMGGALAASTQRVAVLEAELGTAGDRDAVKAELAARQADLAAAAAREAAAVARAQDAERALTAAREQLEGWQGVARAMGVWINAVTRAPSWQTLAALRAAVGHKPRRGGLFGWRGRPRKPTRVESQQLADAALIRNSRLFDAGWYIASQKGIAETGADPVWHYILRGGPAGADPGPWFDTAAWRAAHPDVAGNPLAQAIRHGHVTNAAAQA